MLLAIGPPVFGLVPQPKGRKGHIDLDGQSQPGGLLLTALRAAYLANGLSS